MTEIALTVRRVREILAAVDENLPSIESEAQRLVLYLVDMANVYGRMEFLW